MATKCCSRCKTIKDITCFHSDKSRPGGRSYWCIECKRVNCKAWVKANPEKAKAYQKKYIESHKEEIKAKQSIYIRMNRAKRTDSHRKWIERNRERAAQYQAKYLAENRQRRSDNFKRWRSANLQYDCLRQAKRRAKKRGLPNSFSKQNLEVAMNYWGSSCAVCNQAFDLVHKCHLDHWIPLSDPSCPGTIPENMVPLCDYCNLSKNAKAPSDWLKGKPNGKRVLARIMQYLRGAL